MPVCRGDHWVVRWDVAAVVSGAFVAPRVAASAGSVVPEVPEANVVELH